MSPVSPDLLTDTSVSSPLIASLASLWTPPERLPLSLWSEKNIILSPEYAARASALRLFNWQVEIFDSFTDPSVEQITLMVSTQTVKTIFLQAAIAYVASVDPGPILLVEPKDEDAKAFTKERLNPMIRDCPCLRGLISNSAHTDESTLTHKIFPGGSLSLVGAISPANLARRSIRFLFCDEIDKYPLSAGKEGDSIKLAWERTSTFESRRKMILCCSPTVAGRSRIADSYNKSDRRKFYVPCGYCLHLQLLRWTQVKDKDGGKFSQNRGRDARYECERQSCKARWNDEERWKFISHGKWIADNPEVSKHAGFWLSHLYVPWQTKRLSIMARDWLEADASGPEQTMVFINTNLAELWEEGGETPDHEKLRGRAENYAFNDDAVIPSRGLFLTSAVDVQDSPPRLEVSVRAWGRGRENWLIAYYVIQVYASNGQPLPVTSPEVWDELDRTILQRDWAHESGHTLPITVMCIDTGKRPDPVYAFARRHAQLAYGPAGARVHAVRTVVPIKGDDDHSRIISGFSSEDAARSKRRQGVRIVSVGTHRCKQQIYDSLLHVSPNPDGTLSGRVTPNCFHFPLLEPDFFRGMCAEVKVVLKNGKVVYEQRFPRNEPLDLTVYDLAGATLVGMDLFSESRWSDFERALIPADLLEPVQTLPGPLASEGTRHTQASTTTTTIVHPQVSSSDPPESSPSSVMRSSYNPYAQPVRGIRGRFKR